MLRDSLHGRVPLQGSRKQDPCKGWWFEYSLKQPRDTLFHHLFSQLGLHSSPRGTLLMPCRRFRVWYAMALIHQGTLGMTERFTILKRVHLEPPQAHAPMRIHTYLHISTYTHIHAFLHTYIHVYMYLHASKYTHVHTYLHTHAYTHVHMFLRSHIYIHTQREGERDSKKKASAMWSNTPVPPLRRHKSKHMTFKYQTQK